MPGFRHGESSNDRTNLIFQIDSDVIYLNSTEKALFFPGKANSSRLIGDIGPMETMIRRILLMMNLSGNLH